jgi:hypothetical protein
LSNKNLLHHNQTANKNNPNQEQKANIQKAPENWHRRNPQPHNRKRNKNKQNSNLKQAWNFCKRKYLSDKNMHTSPPFISGIALLYLEKIVFFRNLPCLHIDFSAIKLCSD